MIEDKLLGRVLEEKTIKVITAQNSLLLLTPQRKNKTEQVS